MEDLATPSKHLSCRQAQPTGHVAVREVANAAVRARKILADAEISAAERLLCFERSIEATRANMLKEARADAEQSLAVKALEIAVLRQRSVDRARDDIISLAQVMAERVIREELALKPERLVKLAQQCIHEARGSSRIVLYAHPDDAAYLSQQIENLITDRGIEIRIQPEPEFLPGDLRVETDVGTVDARIGTSIGKFGCKDS